tara:strand:- start:249 stop:362 length:114 start_codon:yes stop_codon:yes gene_type:complete
MAKTKKTTKKKIKKSDEAPKTKRIWNGEQYVIVELKK